MTAHRNSVPQGKAFMPAHIRLWHDEAQKRGLYLLTPDWKPGHGERPAGLPNPKQWEGGSKMTVMGYPNASSEVAHVSVNSQGFRWINRSGGGFVSWGHESPRQAVELVFSTILQETSKPKNKDRTQMRSVKNPWDSHRKDQILKQRSLKGADLFAAGKADLLLIIEKSGKGPAARAAQAEIARRAAKGKKGKGVDTPFR